ncbi:MAG TPA: VOC family protein [Microthrixaceae bacterium]|nr:VOC family protein [Microthrixaceae bacterium]
MWFTVEDCDERAARVTELGGQVFMPPNDMSFGRGAMVADPQGAVFGIAALTQIDP